MGGGKAPSSPIIIVPVLGHVHGTARSTQKCVSPAAGCEKESDQGGDSGGGDNGGTYANVVSVTSSGHRGGDPPPGGEPIIIVGGSVS